MTCWALVPLKGGDAGKQRLAEVLSPTERGALVLAMLDHVLDALQAAQGLDRIALVAPADHPVLPGMELIVDPGLGLNGALAHALGDAAAAGADRVVILPADLPRLTPRDVELLAHAPKGTLAIAPDRHFTGTNALSLPLPAAQGFPFAFGEGSFAAHDAAAYALGLDIEVIESPGLARDLDTPDDLARLGGLARILGEE
jgi:2-phospho-L-lactate guanylyltransferase